jgi:hypothetical protein
VISISFIILPVLRLRDDYVLSTISSDPSLSLLCRVICVRAISKNYIQYSD